MPSAPKSLSPSQAIRAIAEQISGDVRAVFLQGGPGEPVVLRAAWQAEPELAAGIAFTGLMLPGINQFEYSSLHDTASMRLFLATPDFAEAIKAGRAHVAPMPYSRIPSALAQTRFAAVVVQVTPPDGDGFCSLGVCADAAPAAMEAQGLKIGVINHAMPNVRNAPRIALSSFDAIVETQTPLTEFATIKPAPSDALAASVAALVPDGASVQIGIGRLPAAILPLLQDKSQLTCFGGLLTPNHLALSKAGCIDDRDGALVGGVALGDAAFYRDLGEDARVQMAPISVTHHHETLAAKPRFTAINACLEIDLFGQVNAEWAGGQWIASVGGLSDFARAAVASREGKSIIMVQAQAASGATRIKAKLDSPTVTLARADADIFVSEFGVADVRTLDVGARAEAIAAIAAPDHREALLRAWRAL